MNNYYLTIDTGTTNTRVVLWDNDFFYIGSEKRNIGVRNTAIDKDNYQLKSAIKNCIDALLFKNNILIEQVTIIASGMITSNVGLLEIPHLCVPVSIDDLAIGIVTETIDDVCQKEIHFIPGVKNSASKIDYSNFESMDIMRGEEVETIALLSSLKRNREYLFVLPGSHTKFVSVNKQGKITGCLTSITGELLTSVTNYTILADAVNKSFVFEGEYDKQMMLLGYTTAKKTGLGRACFSARIMNQFLSTDLKMLANYLLGAVLQNDIIAVKGSDTLNFSQDTTVVVAGKEPFKEALIDIFNFDGWFKDIKGYNLKSNESLSGAGALQIYRRSTEIAGSIE